MPRDPLQAWDTSTPVLVLGAAYGGLGVARSLGRAGVPVYAVHRTRSAGPWSRYWRRTFVWDFDRSSRDESLAFLRDVSRTIGRRAVLLPTGDTTATFVDEVAETLKPSFLFHRQDPGLVPSLINKHSLYVLATRFGVPTAKVAIPSTPSEVTAFIEQATFPVMMKAVDPSRPPGRIYIIASGPEEILAYYRRAGDAASAQVMLQEYIPGADDTGWTFYGYFDAASACGAAFTARKIRLHPPRTGSISMGIVDENSAAEATCRGFMKSVGYRGVVNIGGKLDTRDGQYKVLDVNPRLGASFRLCLSEDGLDVVRALYLDLTGQRVPVVRPRVGRKWLLEEDLSSSIVSMRQGNLTVRQWLRSLRGVHEMARWAPDDPLPFVVWTLSDLWRAFRGLFH